MASFVLTYGAKLCNGATVLDYKREGDKTTALCKWGGQFVTWRVDQDGNAYLGHYHGSNEAAARDDFIRR